jgi:hypothetical protein
VERQKPLRVFDYECKLYQYQQLAIEVTNPLANSGKFQLVVEQDLSVPVSKDGKPIFNAKKSE